MNLLRPLILITPAYSYYARLFLLRPVLFPGCYGHVYVFRILKSIHFVLNFSRSNNLNFGTVIMFCK
jgi:hypothetical protein